MNPKTQAEQILRPVFNGRPLTVISVSLGPEGDPMGVFRGEPRPGQTYYYTFKMGQTVQFRRVMGKKDGIEEACGCSDCKKHKRTKAECECGAKTDGLIKTKADALLGRLDKKCGASGITRNARSTKGAGQSSAAIRAAFMKRSAGNPAGMMSQEEGEAYVKAKIREHYKKRAVQKRTAKRAKGLLARLALSAAAGGAVGLAGLAAIEAAKKTQKKVTKADAIDLSDLKHNGDGKVYYQGRWWKPNEPVESTAKGKKKMVLAVKDGKVKIVHFGADGYGHNYSEEARKSYLARSAGIKGTDDKHSANYWARKVLWAGKGGSVSQPKGDARFDKNVAKTKALMM